jgi:hypothetical protein
LSACGDACVGPTGSIFVSRGKAQPAIVASQTAKIHLALISFLLVMRRMSVE